MSRRSAGILLYRQGEAGIEVLLVHPGGPFWAKKDAGAWSIPKGLIEENEEPLAAAIREFEEETGFSLADVTGGGGGGALPLDPVRQMGGKMVLAWAVRGDLEPARLKSTRFAAEWPPKSGSVRSFPEIDRASWFDVATAREKILQGQRGFLDQLAARLAGG